MSNNNMRFSPEVFCTLGLEMAGFTVRVASTKTNVRRFNSAYGCTWFVVAATWNSLWDAKHPVMNTRGVENKHILWALMMMKSGDSEHAVAGRLQIRSEKTLRKWAWAFILAIADLDNMKVSQQTKAIIFIHFSEEQQRSLLSFVVLVLQILLSNRFIGDQMYDCLISVDCVDCKIAEPWPMNKESKKWYSEKYNCSALRYEIGVSILGGDIVWVNGPFLPGKLNDATIFQFKGLLSHLEENERIEADSGYQHLDPTFVKSKSGVTHKPINEGMRNTVRARHELVNRGIKSFNSIKNVFAAKQITKHQHLFTAAAVLVQVSFELGENNYTVEYNG